MLSSIRYQLLFAIAVLLLSSWFSIGFHQSDEHYQILEFAAMRAGHTPVADLPWEYGEQMRPGLQPFMAHVVYELIGDPFWTAFLLRLLSGVFTLGVAWLIYKRYGSTLERDSWRLWFAGICLLHWAMWYSGIRFSSENWSGLAFALGFLLYDGEGRRGHLGARSLGIGLLFGLAFCFRYQVGLLVLGFGMWLVFVKREKWSRIALMVFGGLLAVGLGVVSDRWLYSEWVNAPWNYLAQNLIEGKAATFGTRPWWGYFELVFLRGIPPISLLYLIVPLVFFWYYRRHPLTWAWGVFLLVHLVLSRKDVRFLFPLLPLLPVVGLLAWQALQERYGTHLKKMAFWRYGLYIVLVVNMGLLMVHMFRPMRPSLAAARYVYHHLPTDAKLIAPEGRPYSFYGLPAHFYRSDSLEFLPDCPNGERCYTILRARVGEVPDEQEVLWTNRPSWLPDVGMDWYWVVE